MSREIPRPNKQYTMSKKTNQEVAFGKMSHLGGFQIQKAIILAFLIPFWQNSINIFGQLAHSKTASVWNLPGKENVSGIFKLKKTNNKVSYTTSTSPAAAGKFMHDNFQAKEHDSITISNNINASRKAKGKLESLSTEIIEQDSALFMANGLWRKVARNSFQH